MVGGLLVSQVLTLYFTPVYYIYLDKLRFGRLRWAEEDVGEADASRNGKAENGKAGHHPHLRNGEPAANGAEKVAPLVEAEVR